MSCRNAPRETQVNGRRREFEREWNYEARYVRDMIEASPRAAWLCAQVTDLLAAALVVGVGLAASGAAHASVQPVAVSA